MRSNPFQRTHQNHVSTIINHINSANQLTLSVSSSTVSRRLLKRGPFPLYRSAPQAQPGHARLVSSHTPAMTFLSLVYRKAHPPQIHACVLDATSSHTPPVTLPGAKIAMVYCAIMGDLLQLGPDAPRHLA